MLFSFYYEDRIRIQNKSPQALIFGFRVTGNPQKSIIGTADGKQIESLFTDPAYRRRGIAKELLHRVVEDARNYGCGTVQITASDMGVKLYTAYGFVHNGNFMQYKL